jgi:hypothetical protein
MDEIAGKYVLPSALLRCAFARVLALSVTHKFEVRSGKRMALD